MDAGLWDSQRWGLVRSAAMRRNVEVVSISSLPHSEQKAARALITDDLVKWYTLWGSSARPPPELMSDAEVVEELFSLDLRGRSEALSTSADSLKKYRTALIAEHSRLRAEAIGPGPESDSDSESLPQPSHPDGLPCLPRCGRFRTSFPLCNPSEDTAFPPEAEISGPPDYVHPPPPSTDANIRQRFGLCLAAHRAVVDTGQKVVKITQEFLTITGLDGGSYPASFNFETLSWKSELCGKVGEGELGVCERFETGLAAMEHALSLRPLHQEGSPVSCGSGNTQMLASPVFLLCFVDEFKVDLDSNPRALFRIPSLRSSTGYLTTRYHSGLDDERLSQADEVTLLNPEPDATEGEDQDPEVVEESGPLPQQRSPVRASFRDMAEEEKIVEAQRLRFLMRQSFVGLAEGMERRMEAYNQPENTNLITGEVLDSRLTETQKLNELMASYSKPPADQNVCCVCIPCSLEHIEHLMSVGQGFDPSEPEDLKSGMVYGDFPTSKACSRCPGSKGNAQPLHPNPFVITSCYNCSHVVYFGGEIRFACEFCQHSFILPSKSGHSGQLNSLNSATVARNLDNRVFQLLRLTGGPNSELLGTASSVAEAMRRLGEMVQCQFQAHVPWRPSARHMAYGPTLKFSSYPDGRDGLCPRDFLPSVGIGWWQNDGSGPEADLSSIEFPWQDIPDNYEKLPEWVRTNYPFAPEWPTIIDPSGLALRSLLLEALRNQASFMAGLGERFEGDAEQTHSWLVKRAGHISGGGDLLAMVEHKACLAYHTFGARYREQAADFSVTRLFPFERDVGVSIRLFGADTLPSIVKAITTPIERSKDLAVVSSFYLKRFNDGSSGGGALSCGGLSGAGVDPKKAADAAKKADEARMVSEAAAKAALADAAAKRKDAADKALVAAKAAAVKAARSKNSGGDSMTQPPLAPPLSFEEGLEALITVVPGICCGTRAASDGRLRHLAPHTDDGVPICLDFQTPLGCDTGDLPCPLAHVLTSQWPVQLQGLLLRQGGHVGWVDQLTLSSLRGWVPDICFDPTVSLAIRQDDALTSLADALEKMSVPLAEKRPIRPILLEGSLIQEFSLAGDVGKPSPIPLFSASGTALESISLVTIGKQNVWFDGVALDGGHEVQLLSGALSHRCLAVSAAAGAALQTPFVSRPGCSLALEICRQVACALLDLDIHAIPLGSRAGEILIASCQPDQYGYDDALYDLISIPATRNQNDCLIGQGSLTEPEDYTDFSVRLWPVGSTMMVPRESWRGSRAFATEFLDSWSFGFDATCAPLRASLTSYSGDAPGSGADGRHARAFCLPEKLSTFNSFKAHLRDMVQRGSHRVEFRVMSKGSFAHLCSEQGSSAYTLADLEWAHNSLLGDLKRIQDGSVSEEENPFFGYGVRADQTTTGEAQCQGATGPNGTRLNTPESASPPTDRGAGSSRSQGRKPQHSQSFSFAPPDPPVVEAGEPSRRNLSSHPSWLKCLEYMDHLRVTSPTVDRSSLTDVAQLLQASARIATDWAVMERGNPFNPEWAHLRPSARLFLILRKIAFGDHRVSQGPAVADIPSKQKSTLTAPHLAHFEELVTQGHSAGRLSVGTGQAVEDMISVDDLGLHLQILLGYLETAETWRSINLLPSELDQCVSEGIPFAPTFAVQKLDEFKRPRFDENGVEKMRPVADHTNKDVPEAYNSGAKSFRYPKQLGTNDQTIALLAIREEKLNPHHRLQANKQDFSGAFRIVGLAGDTNDAGELSTVMLAHGVINLGGCLDFGGAPNPGVWEVIGSAASRCSAGIDWPSPGRDGVLPPRNARQTDDTFHFVCDRGDRQQRYLDSFVWNMRLWGGNDAVNKVKALESGGFTNYQPSFGKLVDCARRRAGTARSRVGRSEDKVLAFLNDHTALFRLGEVPSAAGSLRNTFSPCPGLQALFTPRLDAMLSDIARHPDNLDPDFAPSPAMLGESYSEGQAMLRLGLEVAWRLGTIEGGRYLYRTFEGYLDKSLRDTLPGKEVPANKRFFEQDASGTGLLFFDPVTGRYIQEWYTKPELAALFDYSRDDKGIIIANTEFLSPTWGVPLLALDHAVIRRAVQRNDNSNVVDALNGFTTCNTKNLECLTFLGIWGFITGIEVEGLKVATKVNRRADPGSRADLQELWEEEKRLWEEEHGRKTERVEVPAFLRDIQHWVDPPNPLNFQARLQTVWVKVLKLLDWYEERGLTSRLRVPAAAVRGCITDALEGAPIPAIDRSIPDFPEKEPHSQARLSLCPPEGALSVPVVTRASLERKLAQKPAFRATLKARFEKILSDEGGQPAEVSSRWRHGDMHDILGVIMQDQFAQRMILWEESKDFRQNPLLTQREAEEQAALEARIEEHIRDSDDKARRDRDPRNTQPCTNGPDGEGCGGCDQCAHPWSESYTTRSDSGEEPTRWHESFCGYGSLSRSVRDSGGVVASLSEHNPGHASLYHSSFPNATYFRENAEATPWGLSQAGVEGVGGGPPCQSHSPGNPRRKGNSDVEGSGLDFEESGGFTQALYNGEGAAFGIWECSPGIYTSQGRDQPSPFERMLEAAPSFRSGLSNRTLRAANVKSPLTGFQAPVAHERAFIVLLNQSIFPKGTKITIPSHPAPTDALSCMDQTEDTPGRFVMPVEDAINLVSKHRSGGAGNAVHYIGSIADAPPGYGEGAYPSTAWDPSNGLCPTVTTGGAGWAAIEFNGRAVLSQVTNQEAARLYGLTDLPTQSLHPTNEFGRFTISHAIIQPVADAVVGAVLEKYEALLSLKESKEMGYGFRISPRSIFRQLTRGVTPLEAPKTIPGRQLPARSRNSAGPPAGDSRSPMSSAFWSCRAAQRNQRQIRKPSPLKSARPLAAARSSLLSSVLEEQAAQAGRVQGPSLPSPGPQLPALPPDPGETQIRQPELRGALGPLMAPPQATPANPTPRSTGRGRARRGKPLITPGVQAQIDLKISTVKHNPRQKNRDNKARHYLDFFEAKGWDPIASDASDLEYQAQLKQWIAYECGVRGVKGATVKEKMPAVDQLHRDQGFLAPSRVSESAMAFLNELIKGDVPAQPRLPVPRALIDIFLLESDMNDFDVEVEATAQSTGHDYCLRAKEYLKTEKGFDPRALHWRDVYFKQAFAPVTGLGVADADRVTLSLLSSKNGLLRCTRSTVEVPNVDTNAVARIKALYLRVLREKGVVNPLDPVFLLKDGSILSRKQLSSTIQRIMLSVGVPARLVGSHSLRRGGASMYRAAKVPDEDIKRFGRWNSDAFKLYIHIECTALDQWAEAANRLTPRFELN